MTAKEGEYRRLPGRKDRLFTYHLLYQGPDHLLGVSCRFFVETYKRFYFKDIQAITCRRSRHGLVLAVVLAVVVLLLLLPVILQGAEAHLFWKVTGTLAGMVLALHLVRGPTSVCHIYTAVQTERLPSLARFRAAREVLARIRPLIEEVQGNLETVPLENLEPARLPRLPAGPPLRPESGRVHQVLFLYLFLEVLGTAAPFVTDHPAASIPSTLVSTLLPIPIIIALVKQYGSDLPAGVKGVTWGAGVYAALNFAAGYGLYIYVLIGDPSLAENQWRIYQAIAALSPYERPWYMTLLLLFGCAALFLAVLGLALLSGRRRATAVPDAPLAGEA
ncbi:MAG: hypothetical protein AB1896_15565 [Thermodesulfobacteriota bacterium]